jgi:glutamine synthetase
VIALDGTGLDEVHEVIVALPDLQGRLQGSRIGVDHFLAEPGFPACEYLVAVDVDMVPVTRQDRYGDLVMVPDLGTLRSLPWDEGTALVVADARWPDGRPVAVSPRQVLRDQLARLAERDLVACAGTELEFLLFRDTFAEAYDRDYRGLRPATRHNVDYSVAGVSDLEPVVRRIRREMVRAGLRLESARGECHPGQYEIVFRYDDALSTCDNHVLYKTGVRQIAAQEGMAATFMAKFDEGEGNSCHVHLSLRSASGEAVFAGDGMSPLMRHFVAGQLACLREFALLYAPNVNSYKRLAPGAFAPTVVAWGRDNRTCPVRVVGEGPSLRLEHRVPGGDTNPYTAVAGMIAAGLYGIEHELPLEDSCDGNAFDSGRPRLPTSLGEAVALWEGSAVAAKAFGTEVVAHLAAAARAELDAYGRTVTDWERRRGFERL